ncbi:NADH:ubiquinone dehydrogenase subunit 5, partial [Rhizopus azygosporus]
MPTPVSALIHAATLVTAGVYLMLRSSPIIEYGPTVLVVITWVGALTAFFAATTGLLQNDLKRVIAYSTCSQMGYLFMAVGLSQYNVALFHLVNHAFFKALLFLAAGAVIHGMADQQDLRRLGGLVNFLPFTYTAILIGSLSLMALPFMTGFYSKDLILEVALGQYEVSGTIAYWLVSLTFFTTPNAPKGDYLHAHEAPMIIVIPLVILSIMSIVFGYIAKDMFVGVGTDFLSTSLYQHPNHITLIEAEFGLPLLMKLLPAIGSVFGAGLALYLYHVVPNITINLTNGPIGYAVYSFLNAKWYWDALFNGLIISAGLRIGLVISKVIDRGIIELTGPYGLSTALTGAGRSVATYDTGSITNSSISISTNLLAFGAVLSGVLVITSVNPVISVLFLISVFVNAAGYLVLLGVGFVGISYLIVYVGAIAILFLFVVMMLNISITEIVSVGHEYTKNIPLGFIVGTVFFFEILSVIPAATTNAGELPLGLFTYLNGLLLGVNTSITNSDVNMAFANINADNAFSSNIQIEAIGQGLYTYGSVWLLLASFILLLAMSVVGSIPSTPLGRAQLLVRWLRLLTERIYPIL